MCYVDGRRTRIGKTGGETIAVVYDERSATTPLRKCVFHAVPAFYYGVIDIPVLVGVLLLLSLLVRAKKALVYEVGECEWTLVIAS